MKSCYSCDRESYCHRRDQECLQNKMLRWVPDVFVRHQQLKDDKTHLVFMVNLMAEELKRRNRDCTDCPASRDCSFIGYGPNQRLCISKIIGAYITKASKEMGQ